MKKLILLIAFAFSLSAELSAQISLAHSYAKPFYSQGQIVNLSRSGKKIMTLTSRVFPDTIFFYNMDYSLWKSIICPTVPGYGIDPSLWHPTPSASVMFPSETLFNTDSMLEIALFYVDQSNSEIGKLMIVNENNASVDSIVNMVRIYGPHMKIFNVDTLGVGSQMVVPSATGIDVYNLPGRLPCSLCGNAPGLAIENHESPDPTLLSEPIPNPSSDKVKVTFTLPEGAREGELFLYDNLGNLIKSCKIDNRFGFILLDNSSLPSGMYYYHIVANGNVSATQKLVLVK